MVLLLLLAHPASAGPWVRPQGEAYVFIGHEEGKDGWTSIYAEYGGARQLTWGLDTGGHAMGSVLGDPDIPLDGRIRVFARLPVLSSEAARATRPGWLSPWLFAVEASIGLDRETNGDQAERVGLGLTAGRPLDTAYGTGWTTFDLRATAGGGKRRRLNAQYVVGVKPTDRLTLELGLFAEHETDLSTTIAPTVEYKIGDLGGARLGVSFKDGGDTILRVGWARSF
ncbi:hypothetical protein JANAI62_21100 [Jannaschia pagri]|uniref:MetA-pathway of phenol degradation n=1 Tax=Jannaschia pagri TaxID=2829797 RepID=A0ABQ4NMZ2_9RHOB|nr:MULTISPECIES: hypothetical protein [unclassified Jannaschia]GIT91653.1 hypothetical protein JANAI61_21110 [Jannaschia sp. AI_61]GIT95487.1 hypothetical protein JANAI62_21100 [Jannaschia sp. AI_62]